MPQRDGGGARRERIVDMDDVQPDPAQQLVERAAQVDRDRSDLRARAPRHREA